MKNVQSRQVKCGLREHIWCSMFKIDRCSMYPGSLQLNSNGSVPGHEKLTGSIVYTPPLFMMIYLQFFNVHNLCYHLSLNEQVRDVPLKVDCVVFHYHQFDTFVRWSAMKLSKMCAFKKLAPLALCTPSKAKTSVKKVFGLIHGILCFFI